MSDVLAKTLVDNKIVDERAIEEAIKRQVIHGGSLDTNLLESANIQEDDLLWALGEAHRLPTASRADIDMIGGYIPRIFPLVFAETYHLVPYRLVGQNLGVLANRPGDGTLFARIRDRLDVTVKPTLTIEVRLHYAMHKLYGTELQPRYRDLLVKLDGPGVLSRSGDVDARASHMLTWGLPSGRIETKKPTQDRLQPIQVGGLLARLAAATDRDTIVDILLEVTSSTFEFAAIFLVHGDRINGWRGMNRESTTAIARISMPVELPSVFQTIYATNGHYLGPLPSNSANMQLIEDLGRQPPRTAFLAPLLVGGKLAGIIYADNGGRGVPSKRVASILLLTHRAGMCFESLIRGKRDATKKLLFKGDPPTKPLRTNNNLTMLDDDDFEPIVETPLFDEPSTEAASAVLEAIEQQQRQQESARLPTSDADPPKSEPVVPTSISAPPIVVSSAPIVVSPPPSPFDVSPPPLRGETLPSPEKAFTLRVNIGPPPPAPAANTEVVDGPKAMGPPAITAPSLRPPPLPKPPPLPEPPLREQPTESDPWESVAFEDLDTAGVTGNFLEDTSPDASTAAFARGMVSAASGDRPSNAVEVKPDEADRYVAFADVDESAEGSVGEWEDVFVDTMSGADKNAVVFQDQELTAPPSVTWEDVIAEAAAAPSLSVVPSSVSVEVAGTMLNEKEMVLDSLEASDPEVWRTGVDIALRLGNTLDEDLRTRFPGVVRVDPFAPGAKMPPFSQCSGVTALLAARGVSAAAIVLPLLESNDAHKRFFAIYYLYAVQYPAALEMLARRLYDAEPRNRFLAADALRTYRNEAGYRRIIQGLRDHLKVPVFEAQVATVQVLGQLRDPSAVPSLIPLVVSPRQALARSSSSALTVICGQAFGTEVARWAEWWQSHFNKPRESWLVEGMRHPDANVRRIAAREFQILTGRSATDSGVTPEA